MRLLAPLDLGITEIKRYVRDRQALLLSLALPVALLAVMVGAFGGSGDFSATASIVDLDSSPESEELIRTIEDWPGLTVELLEEDRARQLLEGSQRLLVTHIQPGYGQSLASGLSAPAVQFHSRGGGGDEGRVVAAIVRSLAGQQAATAAALGSIRAAADEVPGADPAAAETGFLEQLAAWESQPLIAVVTPEGDGTADAFDRTFSGILTMIVMFTVATSVAAIVLERENGTLERLLITRLGATGIFLGKYLGALARGFAPAVLLTGLAWAINRSFSPAQFAQILLIGLLMAAAAAAIGMLIAGLARSQAQANWAGVTITLVMATLGGSFFQGDLEGTLDLVGYATINRYANDALRGLIEDGTSLADHGLEMAVLAGVALGLLVLGRFLFATARPGG
ncbi:MAG: ABC transporter permease [Chloroflexi bacterium]|nr:ABC transporter permease [Chloroflexota bacterium]